MKLSWIFVFAAGIQFGAGEKILAIVAMTSRSHYNLMESLCLQLTNKGHEVTLIAPFKQPEPVPRLKEIFLPNLHEEFMSMMTMNNDTSPVFKYRKWNKWLQLIFFPIVGPNFMDIIFSRDEVKDFLNKNEKFDLVLGETIFVESFMAGIAYTSAAPIVAIAPFLPNSWANFMVGNPAPASYIPDPFLEYNSRMSFWERVGNTLYGVIGDLIYRSYYMRRQDKLLKKHFGDHIPYVADIIKNTSLILVNHHFSLAFPRPYLPNMVEIGGYHINPPKQLPPDLQKYFDESKEGVILFSLGSHIKSSDLPKEKKEAILKAFSRLKQDVLWKYDDETLTDLPKNVKILKWIPQSEILAHPNLKLFITHGGLLSTTEAVTRGVPIVGIPIAGDQPVNMKYTEAAGFGLALDLDDMSEDRLYDTIMEVLINPKYKDNVKRGSELIQDRPLPAMDTALYWIEYVLRHKGAPYLRSSSQELTWYEVWLLDVLAFIFITSFLFIFISFHIVNFIVKKLFCSKKPQASLRQKEN